MDDRRSLTGNFAENVDRENPSAEIDSPLLHPRGQFANCGRATKGVEVLGENLFGRRNVGRNRAMLVFLLLLHLSGRNLSARFSDHWCSYRMRGSVMAGVTSHFALSLEIVLIDGEHHLHHFASSLLGLFIVLLGRSLNVAETALHSERVGNELHRRDQLVRGYTLQNLDILVNLIGHSCFGRRWFSRAGLSARK